MQCGIHDPIPSGRKRNLLEYLLRPKRFEITQRGTHVPGVHDRPVSSHTDAIHLLLCSCQPPSSNFGLTLTVDDILRPRCKLRLQLLEEESEAGAWAHYTAITK